MKIESYSISLHNRWLFVLAGLVINLCLGAVYSWSIFKLPVKELFDTSSINSTLPFTVFLALFAFAMPFGGKAIELYGPGKVTVCGGVLLASGWIISGFMSSISGLVVSYGVLGGCGVGVVYGAPLAVSNRWFPERRGFAIGLTMVGFGLSPLITAPLGRFLIVQHGPLDTFRIMGSIFLVLIVLLGALLRFPDELEENQLRQKHDIDGSQDERHGKSVSDAFGSIEFKALWFCFLSGTFTGLMLIGITSPIATELVGLSEHHSTFMMAFFSLFNGLGRPLFGYLIDKSGYFRVSTSVYIAVITASAAMLVAPGFYTYAAAFSIFWMIFGGWLAIAPATTAKLFGNRHYPEIYGFIYTAYGAGALGGGFASGYIRDITGGYQGVFYPVIIMSVAGILASYKYLRVTAQREASRLTLLTTDGSERLRL